MSLDVKLETERLILRPWKETDAENLRTIKTSTHKTAYIAYILLFQTRISIVTEQ